MSDIRADESMPLDEEDRLPWLEAVDEDEGREGPSALKLIAAVLIGLVAIGAIVGGVFWMGSRDGETNRDDQLIQAPEGDYKVKPDDPGGMKPEGQGGTAFAASEGADPKGAIDTSAVPEAPVTPVKQAPAPVAATPKAATPAPAPAPKQVKAAPAPAPTPAASGPSIQLGAFSSQAIAHGAWKPLLLSRAPEPQRDDDQRQRPHLLSPPRLRPGRRRHLRAPARRGRDLPAGRLTRRCRPRSTGWRGKG
jgi:hypothetical protein